MRAMPDPAQWRKIDLDDRYAAGLAYQRFLWLMEADPYTAMLNKDTRDALANLIFSEAVLGNESIDQHDASGIFIVVLGALNGSPLARLLTMEFKREIIGLVQTAVLAGKES